MLQGSWIVKAIGVVRSPVKERKQMPPLGVPATVELLAEYVPGLLRIEKHSHIWVLAWLEADRELLQVVPRGVQPGQPESLHGVFAVRSPVRPNPIGLTATRVVAVRGASIDVARLDFIDGTPVLDVKPYFASRDLIFSASNAQIGRPASRENLRESLLDQAVNFHGEVCTELALAVRVFEHFRWEVQGCQETGSYGLALPWERGCMFDAFMGMTRLSPGSGRIRPLEGHRVRFQFEGAECEYELLAPCGLASSELLAAPDSMLFNFRTIAEPARP